MDQKRRDLQNDSQTYSPTTFLIPSDTEKCSSQVDFSDPKIGIQWFEAKMRGDRGPFAGFLQHGVYRKI